MRKVLRILAISLVCFAVGFGVVTGAIKLFRYMTHTETARVELSEISAGAYAILETTVSNVPANNYTITTICNENGSVISIRGSVTTVKNEGKPYAIITRKNIVNADHVELHIPIGSVEYLGTNTSS